MTTPSDKTDAERIDLACDELIEKIKNDRGFQCGTTSLEWSASISTHELFRYAVAWRDANPKPCLEAEEAAERYSLSRWNEVLDYFKDEPQSTISAVNTFIEESYVAGDRNGAAREGQAMLDRVCAYLEIELDGIVDLSASAVADMIRAKFEVKK
jgi:hypothetical protein